MAKGFRVSDKKRVVTVYRLSMNEQDFKIIERYKILGYDIVMLEKKEPQKKTGVNKEELIKYLNNGNIPTELYKEMKERFDKKQNFLRVKSWLVNELKDYADKNNKEYLTIAEIVQNAKEQENLVNAENERAKEDKKQPKKETTNKNQ